jgi:ubiquinone/menaquinone biosynthesis C-methylase UbiE
MAIDSREISRVLRSHGEAKAAYDSMSRWYGLITGFEARHRAAGLRALKLQPGEKVLEIGCGTGDAIVPLARAAGPEGMACGIDISGDMLRVAASRAARAELPNPPRLVTCDATSLPLRDRSFDAIFMSFVLELFDTPEIPVVLGECRRVLKPGGRLCVVAMSKEGGSTLAKGIYERMHTLFPGYVDCRPIYARVALESAGFSIAGAEKESIYGLPMEIVVARSP